MKTLNDYSINIVMYHYVRPIKGSKHPNINGLELENFKKQINYFLKKSFSIFVRKKNPRLFLSTYSSY